MLVTHRDGAEAVERHLPVNFHHSAAQFSAQSHNTHAIYNDANTSLGVANTSHGCVVYSVIQGNSAGMWRKSPLNWQAVATPEID